MSPLISSAGSAISAVSAGGITLDVAGALLLASALFDRSAARAVEEATPRFDFNVELDLSKARETADARIGAVLLAFGFIVQLLADLGWRETTGRDATYAVAGAAIVDLVAVVVLTRLARRRHAREVLLARLQRADVGQWWPICAMYGERLGMPAPRDAGINVPMVDYFARVLGRRCWAKLSGSTSFPDVYTKLRRDLRGTDEWWEAHPDG